MSYDGHARLYQSHKPEQRDSSNNPTYTTYSYNPDDSIATVTDARGAVTTNTYNSRGLLTGVAYSVPGGSGIVDPSDIGYSYDTSHNGSSVQPASVPNYTGKNEPVSTQCPPGHQCNFIPCKKGQPGCITSNQIATIEVRAEDDSLAAIDASVGSSEELSTTVQTRPLEPLPESRVQPSSLCDYLPDNINNPLTQTGASLAFLRAMERLLGQDILADSMKVEASFMGGSIAMQNTRDGDVLLNLGGGLDPKGLFVDIPAGKVGPSFSFTGQKILARGNQFRDDRLRVFENWSGTAGGGYRLYGGVDVSNISSSKDRTFTISGGTGTGINVTGVTWAKQLFRGCLRW